MQAERQVARREVEAWPDADADGPARRAGSECAQQGLRAGRRSSISSSGRQRCCYGCSTPGAEQSLTVAVRQSLRLMLSTSATRTARV